MERPFLLPQIFPDQKAQTAHGDEPHEGEVHQCVIGISHNGIIIAKKVKTRVAKSGYGVEHTEVCPLFPAKLRHKSNGKEQCPQPFQEQGTVQNFSCEPHNAAKLHGVDAFHHHFPVAQTDTLSHEQQKAQRDGHKTKSPDLYQSQNNQLSKHCPVGACIHHHQPCYTGSGYRCKKSIQHRCRRLTLLGGNRQHQKQRPRKDHQKISQGNDLQIGKSHS